MKKVFLHLLSIMHTQAENQNLEKPQRFKRNVPAFIICITTTVIITTFLSDRENNIPIEVQKYTNENRKVLLENFNILFLLQMSRKKIIGKKDFLYELLEENFNCLNFLEAIKKNDFQNFTAETKIKINERVKNIIENTQKNINTILSDISTNHTFPPVKAIEEKEYLNKITPSQQKQKDTKIQKLIGILEKNLLKINNIHDEITKKNLNNKFHQNFQMHYYNPLYQKTWNISLTANYENSIDFLKNTIALFQNTLINIKNNPLHIFYNHQYQWYENNIQRLITENIENIKISIAQAS